MVKRKTKKWGGTMADPDIHKEDETRCIESVFHKLGCLLRQCNARRGHGLDGLYCKRHAAIRERDGITRHD